MEGKGASSSDRWIIGIVDDDEDIHSVIKLAVRRSRYFGKAVEFRSAFSAQEGERLVEETERDRFVLAFVDVVMERETAGLDLVEHLRKRFGTSLQLVLNTGQPHVMSSDEVTQRYEISSYLSKLETTPERLRTIIAVGIRNFRLFTAMRVLCESLSELISLFETATSVPALDRLLERTLSQYAVVWQFEYLYAIDLEKPILPQPRAWHAEALTKLRTMELDDGTSGEFRMLGTPEGFESAWGCVVTPLGGSFSAAFAVALTEPPPAALLGELRVLFRSWALTRESIDLKQRVANEQKIREELQRERREAIALMVAGVAHEVNTPLGVANAAAATIEQILSEEGFVRLLEDDSLAESLADLKQSAGLVRRNISRADDLIRSFRKLSVGQLVDRREELDLAELIEEIINVYSPKARRQGITIHFKDELDPRFRRWMGYGGYFSQILLNLMDNAARHAYPDPEQGGRLDIVLSSTMDDIVEFVLKVTDHGGGIPAENIRSIFEAFFTTARDKGGTGLGLATVHNIVTSIFDGTITCESKVGKGTTFTILFSHCTAASEASSLPQAVPDGRDRLEALQKFVALQEHLVRGGALSAEEQLRLAELREAIDGLLRSHSADERRKFVRIPARSPIEVTAHGRRWSAELRSISQSGAAFASDVRIEPSAPLELHLPDSATLEARAINVEALEGGLWRVGVAFEGLAPKDLRSLKLFIAKNLLAKSGIVA